MCAIESTKVKIDLVRLNYGDSIPNFWVEAFTGVSEADSEKWSFAQMRMKCYLEEELERMGKPCTICVRKGILVILTHEEAAAYNRQRFNFSMYGMFRSHLRNLKVDRTELELNTKKEHLRTLEVQSKILQAVQEVAETVKLEETKRKTPGLLSIGDFEKGPKLLESASTKHEE